MSEDNATLSTVPDVFVKGKSETLPYFIETPLASVYHIMSSPPRVVPVALVAARIALSVPA